MPRCPQNIDEWVRFKTSWIEFVGTTNCSIVRPWESVFLRHSVLSTIIRLLYSDKRSFRTSFKFSSMHGFEFPWSKMSCLIHIISLSTVCASLNLLSYIRKASLWFSDWISIKQTRNSSTSSCSSNDSSVSLERPSAPPLRAPSLYVISKSNGSRRIKFLDRRFESFLHLKNPSERFVIRDYCEFLRQKIVFKLFNC